MRTADGISSIEDLSGNEEGFGAEENFGKSFEEELGKKGQELTELEPSTADQQPRKKSKDDSEISADHIELSVSQIKTENLQWMKEKPVISLIK